MLESETFKEAISKISIEQWNELFDLIPQIEETTNFHRNQKVKNNGENLDVKIKIDDIEVLNKLVRISYNLGIIVVFDWMNWDEGKKLIENNDYDFSNLDIENLCKLLTIILRADRFIDGYLESCYVNGIILKILKSIKSIVL